MEIVVPRLLRRAGSMFAAPAVTGMALVIPLTMRPRVLGLRARTRPARPLCETLALRLPLTPTRPGPYVRDLPPCTPAVSCLDDGHAAYAAEAETPWA